MKSFVTRLRLRQIRFCSRVLIRLCNVPWVFSVIKILRDLPVAHQILIGMTGYNRPFATLQEATKSISSAEEQGHEHPKYVQLILSISDKIRPSDYPALFHIQPLLPSIRTVFDFGGSAGNVFYCYSHYLPMPRDLVWMVYDLPKNMDFGIKLARERKESRLRFTETLSDADGVDLFIASGSIHYFEKPLPDMIANFKHLPRYVLINRTPLVEGVPFATVQDGEWRLGCMLHNRADIIQRFDKIGYDMLDTWRVNERSLIVPCYPDRSATHYTGIFFKLRAPG